MRAFTEDLNLIKKDLQHIKNELINYNSSLEKYINWVKKYYKKDPNYYTDFEYLYNKVLKMEQRYRRKKIEVSEDEICDFLEEELYVEFRLFSLSDMEEIMKIEELSFKNDSYPKSKFIELYEEHPKEFFVATIFGKIVGYVVGYISDGIGEIDSLTVDSCYRHLGIGKKLLMLIFKEFRKKGINEFSLEVRLTNDAAIQFYKNLGFQIIETIKGYYKDKGDAYLMKINI